MKHPTLRLSPWGIRGMTDDTWRLADRLNLVVVADSPKGPFYIRHPRLIEDPLKGAEVNALVARAAAELTA